MSELRANNLKKRYKSRTVVQDVSFSLGSGEVIGLLGPNGAGKSTTTAMIGHVLRELVNEEQRAEDRGQSTEDR